MRDLDVAHSYTIPWHEHKRQREEETDLFFGANTYILLPVISNMQEVGIMGTILPANRIYL